MKQGNLLNFFKSLIRLYLSYILLYIIPFYSKSSINGGINFYVKENMCRPFRQIQPEIGESPAKFQITNQNLSVVILFLYLGHPQWRILQFFQLD